MKFHVLGRMRGDPSINLDASVEPLDFETSIKGVFHGELGPFKAHIGTIPIRMTVPFLKRRPVMASVGGFCIDLNRFAVDVEKAGLDLRGVVGREGVKAQVRSKVDCTTEVELNGNVSGRVGLSHLDLCEEKCPPPKPVRKRE